MGRPAKPKPVPIEPEDALDRLHARYGGDSPRSVFEAAVIGLQTGQDLDRAVVLDALAMLILLREELDDHERELLRIGHEELSMAMSDLAPGLGVTSRQAAEQRYQRRRNGASAANPSNARRRRYPGLWWLDKNEADVVAAAADLLTAVNGNAEMKPSGYEPYELLYILKYSHDVAGTVTTATHDPETVAKAARVSELYQAMREAMGYRRNPDDKRVQLAPPESWGE